MASIGYRNPAAMLKTALLVLVIACASCIDPLRSPDSFRIRAAQFQIQAFMQALYLFKADTGEFPSINDGLAPLVADTGKVHWNGPYLRANVPLDPWGHPYEYRLLNGSEPEVLSLGADGRPGGTGPNADISSRALPPDISGAMVGGRSNWRSRSQ